MIFLYHGIVADDAPPERSSAGQALPLSAFRKHIHWLKNHFVVLPLHQYIENSNNRRDDGRRVAALTFDDGLAGTFELVFPLLSHENIPATIFVATSHLDGQELLWFSYLNALCFERIYELISAQGKDYKLKEMNDCLQARRALGEEARLSGSPSSFARELEDRYPLPGRVRKVYGGMTQSQFDAAARSEIIEVGSHSVSHPFLSQLALSDQAREIRQSKSILTQRVKRPVRFFAYPGGDYTADTIMAVREAGYVAAFATIPKQLGSDIRYEMSRIGIYSASLLKVKLKALGLADKARSLGFEVG